MHNAVSRYLTQTNDPILVERMWRISKFIFPRPIFSSTFSKQTNSRCFCNVIREATSPASQPNNNSKPSRLLWLVVGTGVGSALTYAYLTNNSPLVGDSQSYDLIISENVTEDQKCWSEPVKEFVKKRIRDYSDQIQRFKIDLKEFDSHVARLSAISLQTILEDSTACRRFAEEISVCKTKLTHIKSTFHYLLNSIESFLTNLAELRSKLPYDSEMDKIITSLNHTDLLNHELSILENVSKSESSLKNVLKSFISSKNEMLSKYFGISADDASLNDVDLDSSVLLHFLNSHMNQISSSVQSKSVENSQKNGEAISSDSSISWDIHNKMINDLISMHYRNLEEALDRQKQTLREQHHEETLVAIADQYQSHLNEVDKIMRQIKKIRSTISRTKESFNSKYLLWNFIDLSEKIQELCFESSESKYCDAPVGENYTNNSFVDYMMSLMSHPFAVNVEPELVSSVANAIPETALTRGLVSPGRLRRQAGDLVSLSKSLVFLEDRPMTLWSCIVSWIHSKLFKFSPHLYEQKGAVSNYIDIARQYDLLDEVNMLVQTDGDLEQIYKKITQLDMLSGAVYGNWIKECELTLQTTELIELFRFALKNRILVMNQSVTA